VKSTKHLWGNLALHRVGRCDERREWNLQSRNGQRSAIAHFHERVKAGYTHVGLAYLFA
jgi:hypothetical protein